MFLRLSLGEDLKVVYSVRYICQPEKVFNRNSGHDFGGIVFAHLFNTMPLLFWLNYILPSLDLAELIPLEDVATCLPIIQEVLQGFKDESAYRVAHQSMYNLFILTPSLGRVVN